MDFESVNNAGTRWHTEKVWTNFDENNFCAFLCMGKINKKCLFKRLTFSHKTDLKSVIGGTEGILDIEKTKNKMEIIWEIKPKITMRENILKGHTNTARGQISSGGYSRISFILHPGRPFFPLPSTQFRPQLISSP